MTLRLFFNGVSLRKKVDDLSAFQIYSQKGADVAASTPISFTQLEGWEYEIWDLYPHFEEASLQGVWEIVGWTNTLNPSRWSRPAAYFVVLGREKRVEKQVVWPKEAKPYSARYLGWLPREGKLEGLVEVQPHQGQIFLESDQDLVIEATIHFRSPSGNDGFEVGWFSREKGVVSTSRTWNRYMGSVAQTLFGSGERRDLRFFIPASS